MGWTIVRVQTILKGFVQGPGETNFTLDFVVRHKGKIQILDVIQNGEISYTRRN